MFERLYGTISAALAVENAHGSEPGDVATAIVSLACCIAKASGVRGGPLSLLTSNVVVAEPNEEKAIAAIRAAYAIARKPDTAVYS